MPTSRQKKSRRRTSGSPVAKSVVERRGHIVDIARALIGEMGIEGITMRDLAQRCGVAVATLYNQFGSRQTIIAEALREDFADRYEPFPEGTGPAARFEARITAAAAAIVGPMRDYTRSVMFFYFHYNPDSELRASIHDSVVKDFAGIVRVIQDRGDLLPWINPRIFADDLVTQLYSIATKFTQGYIGKRQLKSRLMQAGTASFAGICAGATRAEFEALAQRHASSRQHQNR